VPEYGGARRFMGPPPPPPDGFFSRPELVRLKVTPPWEKLLVWPEKDDRWI
jgi:hypothetical protein